MKYFELFDLEPRLDIDEKKLKAKFFTLSRSVHPDFFTLSSVKEQMQAMEKSTLLNTAYKTLKEENQRIRYVLSEMGYLSLDEKEQMPMDFLMEMMELNEEIEEVKKANNKEKIQEVAETIDAMIGDWEVEIESFKAKGFSDWKEGQWQILKDYYLKQRYARRLKQQLEGKSEI